MRRKIILALIFLLFAIPGFTADRRISLDATGYDWLGYSTDEKSVFVNLIYKNLGISDNKYPKADIMGLLDYLYTVSVKKDIAELGMPKEEFLKLPCIVVIAGALDLEVTFPEETMVV